MEILAELHPKHKLEKLKKEINELEGFDGFDVPDAALGEPSVLPSVMATLVRETLGESKRVIINQRLADVNELYVRSLSITAKMLDLEVAFTRGDRPKFGGEVNQVTTEKAIEISKGYGIRSGGMVSLRKRREDIFLRLDVPADFFLGLHFGSLKVLEGLPLDRIIPYVIVKTKKNGELLKNISQPTFDEESAMIIIEELKGIGAKAILISSPGDLEFLRLINKKI